MAEEKDMEFLLEFREFRGVINTKLDRALSDIKELKDGTTTKIDNHEKRIEKAEKRLERQETYIKLGLFILTLCVGLVIWHLTGYKI